MRSLCAAILVMLFAVSALADVERGAPLPRKGIFGVATVVDPAGLKATRIVTGSTAEKIGLRVNDVLTEFNGKPLKAAADLVGDVRVLNGGDKFKIRFVRDGKDQTLEGTLTERPKQVEEGLDVIYDQVVSQGKRIRVIVTKPKGDGPFPTVFLIGGIGGYSLDGNYASILYGNVLAPIAHAGYTIVRVDKPGMGDSEGPVYKKLTFKTELDAYIQALRLAKTYKFVDPNKIVIYGHSMGGTFGPLVADVEPVKAVIANGTLFQGFEEYMLENGRRQAELSDEPEEQIDQDQKNMTTAMHFIFEENMTPAEIASKHPEMATFIHGTFPDGETFSGVGLEFFRELSHTNLADAWKNAKCDVLSIYNENDFLSGRSDHERIAAYVNKLRPGTATFKLLPGIDHGFSKTTSMRESQQHWTAGDLPFNLIIDDALLEFLKKEAG